MINTPHFVYWMKYVIKNKYVNVPELMIPAIRKVALKK